MYFSQQYFLAGIAYFSTLLLFSEPPRSRVSAIGCEVVQVAGSSVIMVPSKFNN